MIGSGPVSSICHEYLVHSLIGIVTSRVLEVGSIGSKPAITWVNRAQSRTVRAIGPALSREKLKGITPYRLTRVFVGRSPTTPHIAAGKRTDPPVSDPKAPYRIRAATVTPEPLDEPPEM